MKEIKNYEGLYSVTKEGKIFGNKRNKFLRQRTNRAGYLVVNLSKNNILKTLAVHRITAQTFLDNPENKRTVNHKNGNKSNNNINNLEWCTDSENQKHSYRTGLNKSIGENHFRSNLTEKEVLEIRRLLKETKITQMKLSKMFNVATGTVSNIKTRKTWKYI